MLGCASPPKRASAPLTPSLRLSPAALGTSIALQQRLQVQIEGRTQHADALLEINPRGVQLVLLAGPRRLLSLNWDGEILQQQRDPALPAALMGERFLDDIQLAYWPADAIAGVLPPDWTLQSSDRVRVLSNRGVAMVRIQYSETTRWLGKIIIDRPIAGVRLSIESVNAR